MGARFNVLLVNFLQKAIILYILFTTCFCSQCISISPDEYVDRSLFGTTYGPAARGCHVYSVTLLLVDDYASPDILPHQTAVRKPPCPSALGYHCLYIYCSNCPKWGCSINGSILKFDKHCQILFPGGFSCSYDQQGVKVFILLPALRHKMLSVFLIFANLTNKSSPLTFSDQSFLAPLKSLFSLL